MNSGKGGEWPRMLVITAHFQYNNSNKEGRAMYTEQPKKMLILDILDIFQKYTDENHRLSQKDIADILRDKYDMEVDRKSIRRNIEDLIDAGYQIEYTETPRQIPVKGRSGSSKKTEESSAWTDFYLRREISDGELRLLIDQLTSSKYVPYNQCKELVEKLEDQTNIYFKSYTKYMPPYVKGQDANRGLFLNIELLQEAIGKNRKVSFKYVRYGTDKKARIRREEDGTERIYIISPYQMVAKDGKYYLICNYDKYDDISNYRIDRIRDVKILDEQAKPFETLKWSNGRALNLEEYLKEHVYMFSSDNVLAKFRIPKRMIEDILDMFGTDIRLYDETESEISVEVKANEEAMVQFAKCYAPDVIILEPKRLAEQIEKDLEEAVLKYRQ